MTAIRLKLRVLSALCMLFAAPSFAASGAAAEVHVGTVPPAGVEDTIARRLNACVACHGKEGKATSDGYYPRIAGKPAGYLYHQLVNFRDGRRQYPMMIYMVDHLSDAYLEEIANYFSDQHPPYPPPQKVDVPASALERGRVLTISGDPAKGVPACAACHGQALTGVSPAIPGLLGLPRDYISAQFGAWKNGTRRAFAPDCMSQIASRLSVDDVSAVSAWLATRPVPDNALPAPRLENPLPLACGGVPH